MKIAFTGHRNARTTTAALESVNRSCPGAVWIHGGAIGFDTQVAEFCKARGIAQEVIRPDYQKNGKAAPLIRNREILEASTRVLFACYDGRKGGGTDYTVRQAIRQGFEVHFLTCQVGETITKGEWGAPAGGCPTVKIRQGGLAW